MLYARWRIMGTGPPAFTEVDNPASFEENVFLRVSKMLCGGGCETFNHIKTWFKAILKIRCIFLKHQKYPSESVILLTSNRRLPPI